VDGGDKNTTIGVGRTPLSAREQSFALTPAPVIHTFDFNGLGSELANPKAGLANFCSR
jgi:hypothetical protein